MKITTNRKARFEFQILEEFEAGIILEGSEVKSIRKGDVTIADAFIYIKAGELWLKGMVVARYKQTHAMIKHDENRDKKLLLNRKEIQKIEKSLQDRGTTVIPLDIFTKTNKIKVSIAIAKGKKIFDKRQSIKDKDLKRELQRNLK
jgi:SsrA-binding protein